jgi:arginine decarboxylase
MSDVVQRITVPRKGKIVCIPPHREQITARDAAKLDNPSPGLWQQFDYDAQGDLLYRGKRVLDWVERYDAPLSVIDSEWVRVRTRELHNLLDRARMTTNYFADAEVYYAAKARMHASVVLPAYQAGALGETSSVQDLLHLEFLSRNRMLPRNFSIISNGFKLPPERLIDSVYASDKRNYIEDYASTIMKLINRGMPIMPILDSVDELAWFGEYAPRKGLDVGIRLAFGKAHQRREIDFVTAGFGLTPPQALQAVKRIAKHGRLTLRMLHAMVGAAETMPIEEQVDGARVAAQLYFEYKRIAPTLESLNFGGGLPPLSEAYDHNELFCRVMTVIQQEAERAGFDVKDVPIVAWEPGSLIAAESTFNILPILATKTQGLIDSFPVLFGIADASFIESAIDGLLLGHDFPILPANLANKRAYPMWLRGVTCDSMDIWPPSTIKSRDWVRLPVAGKNEKLYVVVAQVGAYQESLTGKGGVNHCAVKEPAELILDGEEHVLLPGTYAKDKFALMGYRREVMELLDGVETPLPKIKRVVA